MPIKWNQPYPVNHSLANRWRASGLFGLFVFIFLFGFKPFGLHNLNHNLWLITLGYGFICFGVMVILNIGVYHLFPSYFSETKWNTIREIAWSAVNIGCIGLGNYLYSSVCIEIIGFKLINLLLFEWYTLAIGIFPITVSVLINQTRLSSKFQAESAQINKEIPAPSNTHHSSEIRLENGIEPLQFSAQCFVFAKANDNYVEVYIHENDTLKKKLIRNTLSKVYLNLQDLKDILKCHRSYIVNMAYVRHISGNAQGYKLHLESVKERIPVSRKLNETIKNYFIHPDQGL